ncbi:MAG: gliding motility-associated C-terminal domain-containing protein [Lewinellaceae bacterium]|nr:gliding motility-associated C-terminal domain-containing protein [Lewinellaceae bacterium]
MLRTILLGWFGLLTIASLSAQISNDNCSTAIILTNLDSWCSDSAAYTTVGATDANINRPRCFPQEAQRDIWFAFDARATDVSIAVTGETRLGRGGSLRTPQVAIFRGTCGALEEVQCISDNNGRNVVQIIVSGLAIGERYYFLVSARGGNAGSFQLCINNFNATSLPSSDCATGVVLCDKSPFTVSYVDNFGTVRDPINDVFCVDALNRRNPVVEEQSTWFKWTCREAGSLTFTITPINPDDDIDWALYELPSGIDNCGNKRLLRYNISGEIVGAPRNEWERCTGATGTRETDTDEGENCGCDRTDNNFSRSIDMVVGRSYTLVIINYSQTGFGYTLQFGGTGTFVGPEANFTTDLTQACVGKPITFTDASSFAGGIIDYQWSFGPTARTQSANTQGPHPVIFDRPGIKPVVLRVTSTDNCVVSKVVNVEVVCCDDHFTTGSNIRDVACPLEPSGSIDVQVQNPYGPYVFSWADGPASEDRTNLAAGPYAVTITDQATCETSLAFEVRSPDPFALAAAIQMPTCNGGLDGGINLSVNGATAPYTYSWQRGPFANDNTRQNIGVGNYAVQVRDANNCTFDTTIVVNELELILDPAVDAITPPSCNGFTDGTIEVRIGNGRGPYQFDWGDGRGFQGVNSLTQVAAGSYQVSVRDANLCLGSFTFNVEDFPSIGAEFDVRNVSCFGGPDGSILASGRGGTGTYTYQWENGAQEALRIELPVGNYTVTITDGNGCPFDTLLTITQPPELIIDDVAVLDNICFGYEEGRIVLLGAGGTPPYTYAIDAGTFQTGNTFADLPAGEYVIAVMDIQGCTASLQVEVQEPPQLLVDAGRDTSINLGYQLDLRAVPSEVPVTYQWTPSDRLSCTTCATPIANPAVSTTYTIQVTNPDGCIAEDDIRITVVKNRPIYIPNAFSPNADGANDFFTAYGGPAALVIKRALIFDRWGELVYSANNVALNDESLGWDGTYKGRPLNSGVFAYFFEIEFIDGQVFLFEGDVTLVR